MRLVLPAAEVKNNRDLEHPLPPWVVALLDLYLARARPLLQPPSPGPWLFPGAREGRPKTAHGLRQQVAAATEDELGLRLTPHQFRHACGLIYLIANPGGHEVVRHLLGHRSIATTVRFYAGMETPRPLRHYDAVILERRQEGAGAEPGPAPWLSPCPAPAAPAPRPGAPALAGRGLARGRSGGLGGGDHGRRRARPGRGGGGLAAGHAAQRRPELGALPRLAGAHRAARRRRGSLAAGHARRGWPATSRPCARAATRPRTVHMRVEALGLFLGAAAPGADRGPVRRLLGRLRAAVEAEAATVRHGKRARLQSSHSPAP